MRPMDMAANLPHKSFKHSPLQINMRTLDLGGGEVPLPLPSRPWVRQPICRTRVSSILHYKSICAHRTWGLSSPSPSPHPSPKCAPSWRLGGTSLSIVVVCALMSITQYHCLRYCLVGFTMLHISAFHISLRVGSPRKNVH